MKLFNKVAIIGVGLIGGSIALAMKKKKLARHIVGVTSHKKTLSWAIKNKIIDSGSTDPKIAVDAELIILAAPVNTIKDIGLKISKFVSSKAIVTDVGSTKKEISDTLSKAFPFFVGAHPLAGSEKRGAINACVKMFDGSICIITPKPDTNKKSLAKIKLLWQILGAKVVIMAPSEHDALLGAVSHLPHAIAFSLMHTISDKDLKLAPASFRELTRVAASDSLLWKDVFLSNKKELVGVIEKFEKQLDILKSYVSRSNKARLVDFINYAKTRREQLK